MKKKILIISYSYPPANAPAAQRPFSLAKHSDPSKFDVYVLTCGNADSSMGFDTDFDADLPGVTLLKVDAFLGKKASNLRVHSIVAKGNMSSKAKLKSKLFQIASSFLIPDKAIFWLPKAYAYFRKNKEFLKSIDVVFSTSPLFSNHLAARYVKKRYKKVTWITDIRDFHYIEHIEYKKMLSRSIHKKLEKKVLKKADYITVVSDVMKQKFEKKYPQYASKFHLVYNGYDVSDFKDLQIEELSGEILDIFYAGSFYGGVRTPVPLFELLDAAFDKQLIKPEKVNVYIAGTMDPHLEQAIKKYKSSQCLIYLGRIPRGEVLERLTQTHLLWLIIGHSKLHSIGVPIKLYEYMSARRPIVCFGPHTAEPCTVVKDNKLGWVIDDQNDPIDIQLTKLEEIINSFKKGTLQKPLELDTIKKFNRSQQAEKIISLISE
jgi:glycosyltransferase involved in cell wall biosynthesis